MTESEYGTSEKAGQKVANGEKVPYGLFVAVFLELILVVMAPYLRELLLWHHAYRIRIDPAHLHNIKRGDGNNEDKIRILDELLHKNGNAATPDPVMLQALLLKASLISDDVAEMKLYNTIIDHGRSTFSPSIMNFSDRAYAKKIALTQNLAQKWRLYGDRIRLLQSRSMYVEAVQVEIDRAHILDSNRSKIALFKRIVRKYKNNIPKRQWSMTIATVLWEWAKCTESQDEKLRLYNAMLSGYKENGWDWAKPNIKIVLQAKDELIGDEVSAFSYLDEVIATSSSPQIAGKAYQEKILLQTDGAAALRVYDEFDEFSRQESIYEMNRINIAAFLSWHAEQTLDIKEKRQLHAGIADRFLKYPYTKSWAIHSLIALSDLASTPDDEIAFLNKVITLLEGTERGKTSRDYHEAVKRKIDAAVDVEEKFYWYDKLTPVLEDAQFPHDEKVEILLEKASLISDQKQKLGILNQALEMGESWEVFDAMISTKAEMAETVAEQIALYDTLLLTLSKNDSSRAQKRYRETLRKKSVSVGDPSILTAYYDALLAEAKSPAGKYEVLLKKANDLEDGEACAALCREIATRCENGDFDASHWTRIFASENVRFDDDGEMIDIYNRLMKTISFKRNRLRFYPLWEAMSKKSELVTDKKEKVRIYDAMIELCRGEDNVMRRIYGDKIIRRKAAVMRSVE